MRQPPKAVKSLYIHNTGVFGYMYFTTKKYNIVHVSVEENKKTNCTLSQVPSPSQGLGMQLYYDWNKFFPYTEMVLAAWTQYQDFILLHKFLLKILEFKMMRLCVCLYLSVCFCMCVCMCVRVCEISRMTKKTDQNIKLHFCFILEHSKWIMD